MQKGKNQKHKKNKKNKKTKSIALQQSGNYKTIKQRGKKEELSAFHLGVQPNSQSLQVESALIIVPKHWISLASIKGAKLVSSFEILTLIFFSCVLKEK